MYRHILKYKPFDPISVDNIDVVGDWVLEKNDLLPADNDHSNWMALNQPMENQLEYTSDEEIEAFLAGIHTLYRYLYDFSRQSTELRLKILFS